MSAREKGSKDNGLHTHILESLCVFVSILLVGELLSKIGVQVVYLRKDIKKESEETINWDQERGLLNIRICF